MSSSFVLRRPGELLKDKTMKINDVAAQVGYNNTSHFYSVFLRNCAAVLGGIPEPTITISGGYLMNKKVEVSYNPQLGYLKTIFTHNFDFLTGVLGYTDRGDRVEVEAGTYRNKTAKVIIRPVSAAAYRFRCILMERNQRLPMRFFHGTDSSYQLEETEEYLSVRTLRMEIRIKKLPWEVEAHIWTADCLRRNRSETQCGQYVQKYLPIGLTVTKKGKVIRVRESMTCIPMRPFYGFGEKFTEFNKRGQKIHWLAASRKMPWELI